MTEELKQEDEVLVAEDGTILDTTPVKEELVAEEDDRPAKASEEDHPDDEQGEDGESEEEAEARRERNRQRRKENKDRRKEYIDSLRREISARDELLARQEARLAAVERRTHGADMAAVDAELQKAAGAYNYFKSQHAEAVSAANGQLAVEAFERMQQAAERAKQLTAIKQSAQRPQQPQQPPLDPRVRMNAETWLERNNWYDPAGTDMDSKVALSVDQAMAAEGWNPTTEQYWNELDARLKKYLPHRYNSGYNKSQGTAGSKPRVPVAGSGRESSSNSSGGYRLSADRVQALKDAGIWDDPKQRAEAIKNFQQYDKTQGAR